MVELAEAPAPPSSTLMRNVALAATTYLAGVQVLYLITLGTFPIPDRWADVYIILLAAYAGAPEVKNWARGIEPEENWNERLRRGGPFIIVWTVLLLSAALFRHRYPELPLPPEIKEITVKVVGLFFGTYALRQIGRARPLRSAEEAETAEELSGQVTDVLRQNGPMGRGLIAQKLNVPPRRLVRTLKTMVDAKLIERSAKNPTDPNAVYRLPA